jgi:LPS O-antigen subunit length determinant protein (WzzB/FepE family)
MNKKNNNNNYIELGDIPSLFSKNKIFISSIIILFLLFSISYALLLPNIYVSKVLLAPVTQEDSLTSKYKNYSGLAGLAGINLPTENASKSVEAIKRIQSYDFFTNYFLPNIKLENLLAVKKWNPEENIIIYDNSLYNSDSNKWVRKASYPRKVQPSNQEAYEEGYLKVLNIYEDQDNGFVTISVSHQSPQVARKWVEIIVNQINESMREIDKKNAQNAIDFLSLTSTYTNIEPIKDAIALLMEGQMQTLLLASSDKYYIYKIIDSPIIPEMPSSPSRLLIVILGTILGTLTAFLICIFKSNRKNTIT